MCESESARLQQLITSDSQQSHTLMSSRVSLETKQTWSPASSPAVFNKQGTSALNSKLTNHLNVVQREDESGDYPGSKTVVDWRMSELETTGSVQSNPSTKASTDIGLTSFQQSQTATSSETTHPPHVFASPPASDRYLKRSMQVPDIKPTNHLIDVLDKKAEYDEHPSVDQLINENRLLRLNIDSSKKIIEMYEEILDPKASRNSEGGARQWRERIFEILAEHKAFAEQTATHAKELQYQNKKLSTENTEIKNRLSLEIANCGRFTIELNKARGIISDLQQRLVSQNEEVLRLSGILSTQAIKSAKHEQELTLVQNLVQRFQVGILISVEQFKTKVETLLSIQDQRIMKLDKHTRRIARRLNEMRNTEHRLKWELDLLKKNNDDLKEKLQIANATADRLTKECGRLTEQIAQMQRKNEGLERTVAEERHRGQELGDKNKRLHENSKVAESVQKKLRSEVSELQKTLTSEKAQNTSLSNTIGQLNPKYNEVIKELEHAKKEVLTLTKEKEKTQERIKRDCEERITLVEKEWEEKNSKVQQACKENESKDLKELADLRARLAEAEAKRVDDQKTLQKLKAALAEQESKQFEELKTLKKNQLVELEALREKNYKLILERNYCFTEKCQSEHGLLMRPQRPILSQRSASSPMRPRSEDMGMQNDQFLYNHINPVRKYPGMTPNPRMFDHLRQPPTTYRESTPNRSRLAETISQTMQDEENLRNLLNEVS